MQFDMIPLACAAAAAARAWRSAACLNAASSVRLLAQARYACGPPHALAPTPIVRHCASLSHAASPIKASTLAVAAGAGTGSRAARTGETAEPGREAGAR